MKLTMHITVSNTAAIEFLIDPTVIVATKQDLENHNNSTTAHGAALEKKAEAADLAAHTHNSEIHVTQAMTEGYNTAIQEIGEHVNDTAIHVQPGGAGRVFEGLCGHRPGRGPDSAAPGGGAAWFKGDGLCEGCGGGRL